MARQTTHPDADPDEIILRISRGDPGAEEVLVREYRPRIVGLLRQLTQDAARAEDLAHETLIIVLEKLRCGPIDDPALLTNYIMNTAKFHFIGWTRRHGNQVGLVPDCEDLVGDSEDGESAYVREESRRLLEASIDTLGVPRDREILRRIYLQEQDKRQVCDALELNREHFDKVISRARRRLRVLVNNSPIVLA